MDQSVSDLARRCGMDAAKAKKLDDSLTLCKQGYESLSEALEDEPNTKEGKRILERLQSLVNNASPDIKKIQQQIKEAERMRVGVRTYPLIQGPLVDRILQSDHLNKEDLEALRLNVAHIIKQDRARPPGRGVLHHKRDWLIFELAGIWTDLTGRKATYTTNEYASSERTGDFLEFAISAAKIIGANPKSIPERFVDIKAKIPDL